ncbi:TPA: hypothetical protein ACH3X2_005346 [Trebouxia sp. C0005]
MVSANLLLTKRAILLTQQSPKQQIPGIFCMSQIQLDWKPNAPDTAQEITADVATISGPLQRAKNKPMLRIPLRNSFLVLQFDTLEDRDAVVDTLTPLAQQVQNKGKQPAVSDQFSGPPALVAIKKKLLSSDRDLNALFEELVRQSGNISEQEFWAGRQHLLRKQQGESGAHKQRAGVGNVMLLGMRPSADGRTNTVNYQVTPEGVQQTFAERPHVHRAFLANVPAVMDEKAFWTRFFKNEINRQSLRARADAGDKAAALELREGDDELFRQHMQPEERDQENRAKIRRVDPTVNLAADGFDRWSEGATARDHSKEPGQGVHGARQQDGIIQDINRHAAVVMEGLPDAQAQQQTAEEVAQAVRVARQAKERADAGQSEGLTAGISADMQAEWRTRAGSALDDLRAEKQEHYDSLNIQDPRRYFEQTSTAGLGPVPVSSTSQPSDGLSTLDVLRAINPHALRSGMDSAAATQVLQDLHAEHTTVTLDEQGSLVGIAPATDLAKPLQEQCRRVALTCNELLRHFWACLPLTTQPRRDKAARLDRALQSQYDRVVAMQQGAEGTERFCIKQLLKPVDNALNASFERYQEERRGQGFREHETLMAA